MKLTKGRIHKILLKKHQTRKTYNTNKKTRQNNIITCKNYKYLKSLNLKNKTLKNITQT
jgi:hypothetical protein